MGSMELTDILSRLVIFIVVLLLSISIHEAGHAWMSYKFGDDTAKQLGRVTLNPIAHTDILGTLILPIIGFISASMGSVALLGWGKPCPIEPRNWTNYKLANVMVSLAGVLGNLILVVISFVIIKIMLNSGYWQSSDEGIMVPLKQLLSMMLLMNVSLMVFNLLPFPPLDGSKILGTFLPDSFRPAIDFLDTYGIFFLMAFVMLGLTRYIMEPVFALVGFLLNL
jgi:Zn-dependent protease